MKTGGFTLVELLVVLAIVALLAGLALPVYRRVTEHARAAACVANERQLGLALNQYLTDNNLTMPMLAAGRRDLSEDVPVIDNTLNGYAKDVRVFACPADRGFAAKSGTSYYWNVALNGQQVSALHFLFTADPTRIPVLADKEGFHLYSENKVNLLYADGHATQDLTFFTGGR